MLLVFNADFSLSFFDNIVLAAGYLSFII